MDNSQYFTYLWQELNDKWWRIQTTDPNVKKKLRRRKSASLTIECLNHPIVVYRIQYYSPEKARQSLGRLTGQKVKKDAVNGLFFSKTHPILTSKSRGQGS